MKLIDAYKNVQMSQFTFGSKIGGKNSVQVLDAVIPMSNFRKEEKKIAKKGGGFFVKKDRCFTLAITEEMNTELQKIGNFRTWKKVVETDDGELVMYYVEVTVGEYFYDDDVEDFKKITVKLYPKNKVGQLLPPTKLNRETISTLDGCAYERVDMTIRFVENQNGNMNLYLKDMNIILDYSPEYDGRWVVETDAIANSEEMPFDNEQ